MNRTIWQEKSRETIVGLAVVRVEFSVLFLLVVWSPGGSLCIVQIASFSSVIFSKRIVSWRYVERHSVCSEIIWSSFGCLPPVLSVDHPRYFKKTTSFVKKEGVGESACEEVERKHTVFDGIAKRTSVFYLRSPFRSAGLSNYGYSV